MFSVLLIFSAGCAHYSPQPLAPEQTAAQLESRRLDDPGLESFLANNLGHQLANWPETNWDFPKLTLVAFYFHPSLEVARAQWAVASAGLKTAGARPNPSISVTPSYDSQIPSNYSPWLVSATLDVPIETAGKRGKRLAEAEKISESARWNFVSAVWQIRSGVRTTLLDFQIAGQRTGLLEKQFVAQQEIARRLQQRFDAGEISRPELILAQIALNQAQSDLSAARAQQADAHSRLAEALGVSEAALDGKNLDFSFTPPDVTELTSAKTRSVALQSRADVLASLADYAAAEADLQLQVAKQYPDLHLGPGYAWNNGNAGDNEWSLGVTLELPILDQNQGPIAEAEARRKLAAAKIVELQAQIIGQIDRAVAGLHVAQEQLLTGDKQLATVQQQQKLAEAQVKAGATDQLDLLNAQLELTNTRLAQLDNAVQLQRAFDALEDAVQSPLTLSSATIRAVQGNSPNPSSK